MISKVLECLLGGDHCCLCDPPGTHRSTALSKIAEASLDFGFSVIRKDALDIPCGGVEWERYRDSLKLELSATEVARVVVFDNCDRALSGASRNSVEKILSLVGFGRSIDTYELSRIVFALGPRDISAVGLSPDVRERCSVFSSQEVVLPNRLQIKPIDSVGFTRMMGNLRHDEKERCRSVVASAAQMAPRRWKNIDRFLFPLVYNLQGLAQPNPHLTAWQISALCSELWPDRSLNLSIQRFSALVGFEQRALWIDPYLSFDGNLDTTQLTRFLEGLFQINPSLLRLEILARVRNLGSIPDFRRMATNALQSAIWATRITWRVFDKATINAHDRHLVLRNREEAFSLPPVDRILGTNPVGNEVEGILSYSASAPERSTWETAPQIFP